MNAQRTYTRITKDYDKDEIDAAIRRIQWEPFRRDNLPYGQGEAIKRVINAFKIPLSRISRMALYNVIKETHGFYALDVKYKDGQAQLYIADNGCETCVVATDFTPNTPQQEA